jgi:hypothetical protein
MDYLPESKPSFSWWLLPIIVLSALTTYLSVVTATAGEGKKTYINQQYNLTLEYPSNCELKTFGEGFFDLIRDGTILLRASVEDLSFKIFIKESKHKENNFQNFARERAKVTCGADGPDGSSYCDAIEMERAYTSANGLNCLEFYLIMTKENYSTNTKQQSTVGPVYVVDISREKRPLALMLFPGHGKLASSSTELVIREVVDTISLAP